MFLTFLGVVFLTIGLVSLFFGVMSSASVNYLIAIGLILIIMGQIFMSTTTKKRTIKRKRRAAAKRRNVMADQRKVVNDPEQIARARAYDAQFTRREMDAKRPGKNFQETAAGFFMKIADSFQGVDVVEKRLEKVNKLFKDGHISEAEYEQKRKNIISKL